MRPRSALPAAFLALACSSKPHREEGPPRASPSASAPAPAVVVVAPARASSSAAPVVSAPQAIGSVKLHPEARLAWRQIDEVSWQAVADGLPPLPPETPLPASECPAGMALVSGGLVLDRSGRDDTDEVQFLQNDACTHFLTEDRTVNALCDRFDAAKWRATVERLPRRAMRFCIDRYEYPNAYGQYPLVVTTFAEASARCESEGKRLCTESEWTLACEGEEATPYPWGYERDPTACRTDVLAPPPDDDTFKPRTTEHTARGLDVAWHGLRSGESPRCTSPFGVADLIGNVDEWTRSVRRYGYTMILKGGHWGPGRHRCRPQTRGHGPHYVRYDQGFRCCEDASGR